MSQPDPPSQRIFLRSARICKKCGTVTSQGGALPGHGWIELVLWLCYLVPGLIYSIWRRSGNNQACTACKSRDLVGVETPVGWKLVQEHFPGAKLTVKGGPTQQNLISWPTWVLIGLVVVGWLAVSLNSKGG